MSYRIIEAVFEKEAFKLGSLPKDELPECAFIGRSNAGKSSLLNALCSRKSLARTGSTPGRTRSLVCFGVRVAFDDEQRGESVVFPARFVDLPGYGFAKAAKSERSRWPKLIDDYLTMRENLRAVVLLLDIRRDPREEEIRIAEIGQRGGLILALSKADKLSRGEASRRAQQILKQLPGPPEHILCTSARSGALAGIGDLADLVGAHLDERFGNGDHSGI